MKSARWMVLTVVGLSVATAACGGDATANDEVASGVATEASASAPTPTGEVIEVKMITDGAGNYFEPAEITANRGDVIRFVLESGVHNVSFPSGENPGLSDLPAPSQYLQLPGQTYDLTVDMDAGEYFFQCDPHAALGMVGTLTVQ